MRSFTLTLVAVCALFASSLAHGHGHKKHPSPLTACNFADSQGNFYDLSPLQNPPQGAYSFQDDATMVYFNVCGNLTDLVESPCAKSPAGVCTTINDVAGTATNVGNATSAFFSDYTDAGYGVTLTYSNGELCNASGTFASWTTQLNFLCPDRESNVGLGVSSYGPSLSDPCTIQLNLTSVFACPIQTDGAGDMWLPLLSWIFIFCGSLLCCAACCACVRRSRARCQVRKQMERVYSAGPAAVSTNGEYAAVPLMNATEQVAAPIAVAVAAPENTPSYGQYYNPQFFTNQQAFQMQPMMASMYPYAAPPMMSAQAPPASAPSTVSMGAIRTPVRAATNATTDEQLARALQAQYDNEASLV